MKIIQKSLLILLLLSLFRCGDDEVTLRDYPRITTLPVDEITENGARFNAKIIFRGDFEIINFGFVWSREKNPSIEGSDRVIYSENVNSSIFHTTISTTLEEGIKYYVRSFVQTEDYLVYGASVQFTSQGSKAPEITKITPLKGTLGDTVTIVGKKFSYVRGNNTVLFEGLESLVIQSTDSSIVCLVPDSLALTESNISVEIFGNRNTFNDSFTLLKPIIQSISKDSGKAGDTLSIIAKYLGTKKSHPRVFFEETEVIVINSYNDRLDVIVPIGLSVSSNISVRVAHQNDQVPFTFLMPILIDFEPKLITWRDTVTAYVENFYKDNDLQTLKLNDLEFDLIESFEDSVLFTIPDELWMLNTAISFEIAGFNIAFEDELIFREPHVLSIEPDTIVFGDRVRLNVANFHPTTNFVRIGYSGINRSGYKLVELITSRNDLLEFDVPILTDLRNTQNGDNNLYLDVQAFRGKFGFLAGRIVVKAPVINSFWPLVVSNIGDQINIYGKNFGSDPIIKFGNKELEIISATDNQIVAQISENVLQDPQISELSAEKINVTTNDRSGWSIEDLTLSYNTAWKQVDDGGLFRIEGSFLDARTAVHLWDDETNAYLLGGRGRMIYSPPAIPYSQEKLKDFWRFNPTSDTWTQLSNWPQQDNQEEIELAFTYNSQIYAITENDRLINYTSSWIELTSLSPGQYRFFFQIDGQTYIIFDSSIAIIDLSSGEITPVLDMPYSSSYIQTVYIFDNKMRYRSNFPAEEFEFDPSLNTITSLGTIDTNYWIYEHQGKYYSRTSDALYEFSPLARTHTLIDSFPANDGILFRFSLNGKLYFATSKTTMISYDLLFE